MTIETSVTDSVSVRKKPQRLLKPGQVGRLHTARKRENNGMPALVVGVGDDGTTFRVATYESGPSKSPFRDITLSPGSRFDFEHATTPPEFDRDRDSLLIWEILRNGKITRGPAPDPFELELWRLFMHRTGSPAAVAYVLQRTMVYDEHKLEPRSEAVLRGHLGGLADGLHDPQGGDDRAKRTRALIYELAARGAYAQAYSLWLFNPEHITPRFARRLMGLFTQDVMPRLLMDWPSGEGYPRHWTQALLAEILRRYVADKAAVRGFEEYVARCLQEEGVTRQAWRAFPGARRIAKTLGYTRNGFARRFLQR